VYQTRKRIGEQTSALQANFERRTELRHRWQLWVNRYGFEMSALSPLFI
jgi:hypothetical protein